MTESTGPSCIKHSELSVLKTHLYSGYSYCIVEPKVLLKLMDSYQTHFTHSVECGKGTHYPCYYLYILIAEVFAISMHSDSKIKGIPVHSITHKISHYADDTSLTVVGNESIERLAYHLDLYKKASGAKVNRDKCEGLWLGSNQNRTDKPLGFKWQTDKIKVLEIHIGNAALSHTNWDDKIDKFIRTLNLWKMRDFSLKGKKCNKHFSSSMPLAPCLCIPHTGLGYSKT